MEGVDGEESDSAVRRNQAHDGDEGVIECPEEAQPTRTMVTPAMPTQEEMDLHQITHLPYQPWCPECVEGFDRELPHRHKEVLRRIPLISCDYLYFTEKGIFARDELDEEKRQRAWLRCRTAQAGRPVAWSLEVDHQRRQ